MYIKKQNPNIFRRSTFAPAQICRYHLTGLVMYLPRGKIKVIYINSSLNALLSTIVERLRRDPPQLQQR